MSPRAEAWVAHSGTQLRRLSDGVLLNASNAPVTPPPVEPPPSGGGGTPPPTPIASTPQPFPAKAVMLYHLVWPNSNVNNLRNYYFGSGGSNINCVALSFFQGDPPGIVGWTAAGESAFLAQLRELRAMGVRIGASLGGAHGQVNLANRSGVINSLVNFARNKCMLDFWDIDLEAGGAAPGPADAVAIAAGLRSELGTNFGTCVAPNGSNKVAYRPVGKALQDAGHLSMYGQQYYDAVVSESAMMTNLAENVAAGIPANKMSIGMMTEDRGFGAWDVNTCLSRVTRAKQTYPALRGGYLWVERTQTAALDWANRVGNLLKG